MIENLKVGDKVITNSGIYGTIAGLKADRIQLRIAENVKIEMSRNAVTRASTSRFRTDQSMNKRIRNRSIVIVAATLLSIYAVCRFSAQRGGAERENSSRP